jgi:RHS repeat-associated protein
MIGWPTSLYAQGAEEVRYYHTDAVGSVQLVTDATGQVVVERYDYLPFGEPWSVSPSGTETRRFTGQERDPETGFDYFGARQYASSSGRITRPDDPGYSNPVDPQTWNLYAYPRNNPLRFVDPTGHIGECPQGSEAMFCCGVTEDYWAQIRFWWDSFSRSLSTGPLVPQMPVLGPPDPTCVAAARNTGIGIGGVVGGYVGATSGALSGGLGGTAVAPGPGTFGGAYAGGATGFGIGSAGGTVTGGIVGTAVGNILCASGSGGTGGGGGQQVSADQGSFWKQLKPFRGKTKTNGLSGKGRRFFERDRTHGDIEVYDSRGRHLGSADPETGAMTKPPVPGRRIGL